MKKIDWQFWGIVFAILVLIFSIEFYQKTSTIYPALGTGLFFFYCMYKDLSKK